MKKNINVYLKNLGESKENNMTKVVNLVLTPEDYVLQFRVGNEVFSKI